VSFTQIERIARDCGFARVYFLGLEPFAPPDFGENSLIRDQMSHLCFDPGAHYPWATALLLLVKAYEPFAKPFERLPSYYIASNEGYHAANACCEQIKALGFRAERLEIPVFELCKREGIGSMGKNGLISLGELGTRIVFYTIVTDACKTTEFAPEEETISCQGCDACVRACPVNALGENPSHPCIRFYMDGGTMPGWVMEHLPGLLGCEICQSVCKRNAHLTKRLPDERESAAFALEELLNGESVSLKQLCGKNMATRGRLRAQAAVLAAKQGRTDCLPLIRALLEDPIEQVRTAAKWAEQTLSQKENGTAQPKNPNPKE